MPRIRSLVSLIAALVFAAPLYALRFERVADSISKGRDGRPLTYVLVWDCGVLEGDSNCNPFEESFTAPCSNQDVKNKRCEAYYIGDEQRFLQELKSRPEEVWLVSSGGHVVAGLGIGKQLRNNGLVVRVPNGPRLSRVGKRLSRNIRTTQPFCVSSCTIAFMGGVFRYVDSGATYEMHSASSSLKNANEFMLLLREKVGFKNMANCIILNNDPSSVVRHFQNAMLLPRRIQLPELTEKSTDGCWDKSAPDTFYPPAEVKMDEKRYELEGELAMQDIIMRLERRATEFWVDIIEKRIGEFGPRADKAIALVRLMWRVGIKDTFNLTHETMLDMGIETEDLVVQ